MNRIKRDYARETPYAWLNEANNHTALRRVKIKDNLLI